MRNYRKIKTDMENLHFLNRLNRIYNSPKTLRGPIYYDRSHSGNRSLNNTTRTIYLQKTTPISYYPVKLQIFKKGPNDSSYSPERRSYLFSPSYSGYNNRSFAVSPIRSETNNYNYDLNTSNIRKYNERNTYNSNMDLSYRNMGRIRELKNSLGNPKEARNIMINNIDRTNRFISISPSHNSYKDDLRDNNDYLRYTDLNLGENYDEKHQIRNLLSKNYLNKLKNFKRINNNIRNTNNRKYNYNSRSLNFPKKSNEYYINKYGIERSPGNRSNATDIHYQTKTENKIINNIHAKKLTPNITPIINSNTPFIFPQDKTIEEEMQYNVLNRNNIILNNNSNYLYKIVEVQLEDLIFIEGRLNDIILSLNNNKNIFDIGAINETVEFFVFYFHSSLKNKLELFFSEQNRIIIKSAFNLNLFIIMITYHLSLNPSMLIKLILLMEGIYDLLKKNLFLFIRKIELYYGDEFCRRNEIYFKNCDYFLMENQLENLSEIEIINLISKNCVSIVNNVNTILNYYLSINNEYYNDFRDIFLNLSRIEEQDINNYFYNYLFNLSKENILIQQRINNNYDYSRDNFDNYNYIGANEYLFNNSFNNLNKYNNLNLTQNKSFYKEKNDEEKFLNEIILSYKKNKEIPPFLKYKCPKKYTLVLGLENTLVGLKFMGDGNISIRPRPGLISFLTGIKPYYEIISFSKLPKYYSNSIIEKIEDNRKLFDFNLYREHCSLIGRKFVKDISKSGRDMKKIIMVDDLPENLNNFEENVILILSYDGNDNKEDRTLYELKKMLILFYNLKYDDLRNALKSYKNEIYEKITLGMFE